MNKPEFLLRYWIKEKPNVPPTLKYSIFHNEDDLIEAIKSTKGNYSVFTVGLEYESMAYFQRLIDAEKIYAEKQIYLKLKQKYEQNG